ncbi:MAG: hypothetical protein KKA65_04335 [Nanoarchaeota archaeon]|nr:hypothetical protein [Nanoarchaeota archaeon]
MEKGYKLENEIIILNRNLTELDLFVKDFLDIMKKHSNYLIVSGYVSISTGRVRGTEDVDLLVPMMDKEKFKELFLDLEKNDFWCYQGEDAEKVYSYVGSKTSIRFAKKNTMFPNMEFVPIDENDKIKYYELQHPQKIKIKDFEFKISPIEFEILYKELKLGSKKDMEDAKHLRTFFKEILKEENFIRFKKIIQI